MRMKARCFAVAMAMAVTALAGCDRNAPSTSIDLQELPAQAERQIERAVPALDDAAITAMVKTALIADQRVNGMAIDVDTSLNVVTLSGTVGTNDLREEAERVSRKVQGVKDVRNNLVVRQPS